VWVEGVDGLEESIFLVYDLVKLTIPWFQNKNNKYHTVGTIPNSNRPFLERGKFDILNTIT
jgi:hypothetical protein